MKDEDQSDQSRSSQASFPSQTIQCCNADFLCTPERIEGSDDITHIMKQSNQNGTSPEVTENGEKAAVTNLDTEVAPGARKREVWHSHLDFLLSCVGAAVGLGNVWRFPYLCYKNGGGSFLIPYVLLLVCAAVPIFFMEIALGQYMSKGGIGAWDICPIMRGVGFGCTILIMLSNVYYIVVMAWAVLYMYFSFSWTLPWATCDNPWNTDRCMQSFVDSSPAASNLTNQSAIAFTTWSPVTLANQSSALVASAINATRPAFVDAATEFWERRVLQISSGVDEPGGLCWELVLTLALSWCLIYFCVWKGVKVAGKGWLAIASLLICIVLQSHKDLTSGLYIGKPRTKSCPVKDFPVPSVTLGRTSVSVTLGYMVAYESKTPCGVVYFTALFPYVVLTILLIRGVTLPGAKDGLVFYLKPHFSRLFSPQVWVDAGTQVFYSTVLGFNMLIALGSYNQFNHNCYRDCIAVVCINSGTSLYAGVAVFSVLGFMAHQQGVSVAEVAESGPGLVFIAYPKAITQMPIAPFWSFLFFFMIVLVGIDSQFVGVEAVMRIFKDMWPCVYKGWRRETLTAGYVIVSFLIGLTMVTRGGMYVFQLFDYYSCSGMALMWACFFETIAIAWIYGANRFYDNFAMMIGHRINPWLKFCWFIIAPLLILALFLWYCIKFTLLVYNRTYVYPMWAQGLGLCLAFSSMICVPIYVVYKLTITPGATLWQKLRYAATPVLLPERIPTHWPDYEQLVEHYKAVEKDQGSSLGLLSCFSGHPAVASSTIDCTDTIAMTNKGLLANQSKNSWPE